jgi:predicted dehydrogenase
MKTINWGIIGCGIIARKFIEALKSVENAHLVAVASTSGERAMQYAETYHVPFYYDNYINLAKDPNIDAVYIANSHNFHKESALICINHGKAVLCEKSFTVNAMEAMELIKAARSKNVFLMEAMWTRFQPAIRKVKELLDINTIGDVILLTADFGYKTLSSPEFRLLNKQLAGGALLDVGVYPVSFAFHVFGKTPVEIHSNARIGITGVDESSAYYFAYDKGESALLSASLSFHTPHIATIMGTKGLIKIPRFWMTEGIIVELENQEPVAYDFPFRCNGYEYEIEEVNECLRQGKTESKIMPLDETLLILQTMDKLRSQWGLRYPGEE